MARFTGPKHKLSRRVGFDIWGGSGGPATKRPFPPGQHGNKLVGRGGRVQNKKMSNFGKQLIEKQKLRHYYGMLEKQFRNTYTRASKMRGVKGDNFMALLESRLDAVLYRSGMAPTIFAARQLANHGHFLINGKKADIPSMQVKAGDVVSLREKSRNVQAIKDSLEAMVGNPIPPYMMVNGDNFEIKMLETPQARDIPVEIDIALIVEFYSR